MTVKYNLAVSTSRPWTLFKLLFRWRGSIWKSVVLELCVWLVLYTILTVFYRRGLTEEQMITFERIVRYCDGKLGYIPLNFMLGFFVTSVLSRWVNSFNNIGYIDNIALMVAAYVHGSDEKTRMMRRNIVRYCVLSQTLVFRDISMRVRKRFPTIESIVASGVMMKHEKERFDEIQYRYAKYWMPFQWALALCNEARNQQKISSDILLRKVGEEIKLFRTNMAILCNYDWVPLPIMYPQLIVLAVHTYFLICAVSRQLVAVQDVSEQLHIYVPVMTILQFIFYMGWLKVAEAMLNPFGEDDDDFECNFLLDRNLTIGLTVVDQGYDKTPRIEKDVFFDKPVEPLYSAESAREEHRISGVTGSTANVKVSHHDHDIRMMPLRDEPGKHASFSHSVDAFRNSFRRAFSFRTGKSSLSHSQESHKAEMEEKQDLKHSLGSVDNDSYGRKFFRPEAYDRSSMNSLSYALEAMVNESNAYNNSAMATEDDSSLTMKERRHPHFMSYAHHTKYKTHLNDLERKDEQIRRVNSSKSMSNV